MLKKWETNFGVPLQGHFTSHYPSWRKYTNPWKRGAAIMHAAGRERAASRNYARNGDHWACKQGKRVSGPEDPPYHPRRVDFFFLEETENNRRNAERGFILSTCTLGKVSHERWEKRLRKEIQETWWRGIS